MSDKTKFPAISMILGIGAVAAGIYLHYARREQEKVDQAEWERYAEERGLEEGSVGYEECHEAWWSAREYSRKIDGRQLAELRLLTGVVEQAEDLCRVSIGLRKAMKTLTDPSVPPPVSAAIAAHWLVEWYALFGAGMLPTFPSQKEIVRQLLEDGEFRISTGGAQP
jgi:hypothetical protein